MMAILFFSLRLGTFVAGGGMLAERNERRHKRDGEANRLGSWFPFFAFFRFLRLSRSSILGVAAALRAAVLSSDPVESFREAAFFFEWGGLGGSWFLSRWRLRFRSERAALAANWAELGTDGHGPSRTCTDAAVRVRRCLSVRVCAILRSSLTQAWTSASVAQRLALNRKRAGWLGGHSSRPRWRR